MPYDENLVKLILKYVTDAVENNTDNNMCTLISRGESRKKNRVTLAKLGITASDAFDYVKDLKPDDYFKGPEKDVKYPNDNLWIFKTKIKNYIIYIKFKLEGDCQPYKLKVISFHFDNM